MTACGTVCRLLLAGEIQESRCSPRAQMQNRHHQVTANCECFISLFAQPDKTSLQRSANSKNAESNSNFKITRFRTPFIFAIPTATRSRSQPMNSPNHPDLSFRTTAPYNLRNPSAAVLVFFSAAARTWFVAPDLWYGTAYGKINRYFACAIAVSGCDSRHCANGLTHARIGARSGRGWRMLAHQELWQCRQEILECLQVRSTAEQII